MAAFLGWSLMAILQKKTLNMRMRLLTHLRSSMGFFQHLKRARQPLATQLTAILRDLFLFRKRDGCTGENQRQKPCRLPKHKF